VNQNIHIGIETYTTAAMDPTLSGAIKTTDGLMFPSPHRAVQLKGKYTDDPKRVVSTKRNSGESDGPLDDAI